MPDSEATVTFTCASPGCDWTRSCGRFDTRRGVEIANSFDAHEAEEHPGGAHMAMTVEYRS